MLFSRTIFFFLVGSVVTVQGLPVPGTANSSSQQMTSGGHVNVAEQGDQSGIPAPHVGGHVNIAEDRAGTTHGGHVNIAEEDRAGTTHGHVNVAEQGDQGGILRVPRVGGHVNIAEQGQGGTTDNTQKGHVNVAGQGGHLHYPGYQTFPIPGTPEWDAYQKSKSKS